MEALKAEIALKRKAAQDGPSRPAKYLRRGEVEKLKEEEERMKRKAQELKEAGKATAHDAVREGQQGYENFKV